MIEMPFGKYRGRPLSEVPTDYLKWLLRLSNLSDDLREAVRAELKDRPPEYRKFEIPPLPEPIIPPYDSLMRTLTAWMRDELKDETNQQIRERLLDARQNLMLRLSATYGLIPPLPGDEDG